MKTFLRFVIFVLVLGGAALGGTRNPDVPDEKYLKYGEGFKYVGRICTFEAGDEKGAASCVAIRDDIVLTAGHVLRGAVKGHVHFGELEVAIARMVTHPDYDKPGTGNDHDIGICFLERKLDLDFYPGLYDGKDEVGKVVSISGWGMTGTFVDGNTEHDKQRRAGSSVIAEVRGGVRLVTVVPRKKVTALDFCICPGDSGGGLFIDNKLAGINSAVGHETIEFRRDEEGKIIRDETGHGIPILGVYDHESCFTRVSKYREWVEKTIAP
jgi:hypothetical protein